MLLVNTDLKGVFALGKKTVASGKKTFGIVLWARRHAAGWRRLRLTSKKTFASGKKTCNRCCWLVQTYRGCCSLWASIGQEDFVGMLVGADLH